MHKKIAKIESAFLGFEDHDLFTVSLHVTYGGSGQGIGLFALGINGGSLSENDPTRSTKAGCEFIMRVLKACGVRDWNSLKGRTIYVLFEKDEWNARPVGIENLPTEQGEQFLFGPWQDRAKYEQQIETELLASGKLDTERWTPGWRQEAP